MAITIPIITEFADKGIVAAQSSFNTFKTKVGEANGAIGKLKAGSGVAFDAIKANAGTMALGAGAAIGGFALKAIGDFKDLALSVDEFRNKTDLTLDQSSKWVSYTGDLGIEADAMTKIFSRLSKAATDQIPAFEELGVAVAFGPDGSTDIEETFLRVNDAINALDDPVAEAAYRADLFGKGWMNAAELVQMGSDDIRVALDGVKDFEVIDEEEIEKAKDLRAAQDELGDAMARLSVKLGEALIPALTAALDAATPLLELVGKIDADVASSAASDGAIVNYAKAWGGFNDGPLKFLTGGAGLALVADLVDDVDDAVNDNQLSVEELEDAWKDGTQALRDAQTASDDLRTALVDVDGALAELKGNVDERQAWRNLQDTLDDVQEAARRAFEEATPEALRASEAALDKARLKVGEYIAEIDTIPPDRKTDFIARLDQANLAEVERILAYLARPRSMGIIVGVGETPSEVRRERSAALGLGTGNANVTVNVQGSVIAENDLVETVRVGLVKAQRNGAGLVYSNS